MCLHVHTAHVLGSVGEQGHLSSLFESCTQEALVFGACPGLTTGFNFATVRDVAFHKATGVFIIDFAYMIVTELAYFAARCALASIAIASLPTRGSFGSSLHGLFSSIFRRGVLLNFQEGRGRLHFLLKSCLSCHFGLISEKAFPS